MSIIEGCYKRKRKCKLKKEDSKKDKLNYLKKRNKNNKVLLKRYKSKD